VKMIWGLLTEARWKIYLAQPHVKAIQLA